MENTREKAVVKKQDPATVVGFGTAGGFELMQRQASMLASSELVPKQFQGRQPDCCIALEMANRIGASPFMVMQNIYIVHGKPTWSAQFLVSCINACGRFSPLRYKQIGKRGEDTWGVIAWAKDLDDGEVLESPEVTIAIAKAEGWYDKNGSKWQTIPELMLRYRAATFFARTYAPDVTMGMATQDEAKETVAQDISVTASPIESGDLLKQEPADEQKDAPAKTAEEDPADVEIDVDALPSAALPAAINAHRKEPYFVGVMADFGTDKPNKMLEADQRACLKLLFTAQTKVAA